jgi:hypothetical protein
MTLEFSRDVMLQILIMLSLLSDIKEMNIGDFLIPGEPIGEKMAIFNFHMVIPAIFANTAVFYPLLVEKSKLENIDLNY